jgi:hypothetical protein
MQLLGVTFVFEVNRVVSGKTGVAETLSLAVEIGVGFGSRGFSILSPN